MKTVLTFADSFKGCQGSQGAWIILGEPLVDKDNWHLYRCIDPSFASYLSISITKNICHSFFIGLVPGLCIIMKIKIFHKHKFVFACKKRSLELSLIALIKNFAFEESEYFH